MTSYNSSAQQSLCSKAHVLNIFLKFIYSKQISACLNSIPLLGNSESQQANIARTFTSSLIDCGLFQMSDLKNKYNNVLDLVYTNMPELFVVSPTDLPLIPDALQDVAHVQTADTLFD